MPGQTQFAPPFPGQPVPGQPGQQYPGQQTPGQPGVPGQPFPGQQFPGQQFPGQSPAGGLPGGFQPGVPGQIIPGQNPPLPGQPGYNPQGNTVRIDANGQFVPVPNQPGQNPINPLTGGVQPVPVPGTPDASGNAPNSALGMINNMLRGQTQATGNVGAMGGNLTQGGLGIAGVASKYEGPSIKVYKERSKYNEWEFIFDLKNDRLPGQPIGVAGQNGQNGQNGPNGPNGPNGLNGPSNPAGQGGMPGQGPGLFMPRPVPPTPPRP